MRLAWLLPVVLSSDCPPHAIDNALRHPARWMGSLPCCFYYYSYYCCCFSFRCSLCRCLRGILHEHECLKGRSLLNISLVGAHDAAAYWQLGAVTEGTSWLKLAAGWEMQPRLVARSASLVRWLPRILAPGGWPRQAEQTVVSPSLRRPSAFAA